MITLELLAAICPNTKKTVLEKYVDSLNEVAEYYDMTKNPARLASFLAQVAHESGGFNTQAEHINKDGTKDCGIAQFSTNYYQKWYNQSACSGTCVCKYTDLYWPQFIELVKQN